MTAINDLVSLELLAPTSGFVLGRNLVGDPLSQADDRLEWQPYLPGATRLSVVRGGARSGLVNSVDVGVLSATLLNTDPTEDPNLKPNTPTRLLTILDPETDVDLEEVYVAVPNLDGSVNRDPLRIACWGNIAETTASVIMPVQLEAGDEYELTIELRVTDAVEPSAIFLALLDGFEWMPISNDWQTITFYGTAQQGLSELTLTIATFARLWFEVEVRSISLATHARRAIYAGAVQDVATEYRKDGNSFTAITAVDSVQALANTMRYGAVVENGVGYETWPARVRRLSGSSPVDFRIPVENSTIRYKWASGVDGWVLFGTLPARLTQRGVGFYGTDTASGRIRYVSQSTSNTTNPVTQNAYAYGLQRTFTGLVPGRRYVFSSNLFRNMPTGAWDDAQSPNVYALGVVGMPWGDSIAVPVRVPTAARYDFIATADTHTVRLSSAETFNRTTYTGLFENIGLSDMTLTEYADELYLLQDIVYESTLLNHLELACNSVGASFYVDKANAVQFKRGNDQSPFVAHFADVHDPDDPLHVCYTDVGLSYDTKNVVNDLTMAQHGRKFEDGQGWVADDYNAGFTDQTSLVTWGQRAGTVDTSIYDKGIYFGSLVTRASELLSEVAEAEQVINSVTFDATNFRALAARVELQDRVQVTARGNTHTCRVLGITHDIWPDKWLIKLDLGKD